MNDIQIFKNEEFGTIRTIEENGKVLFCGSDIAKALGYDQPHKAIKTHCKGDGGMFHTVIDSLGRKQEARFISEGNLYRLITHSKLPSAEKFEKWVFDEVLPSIRKNGGYIAGQESLTDEELLAKALLVAQNKITERDEKIKYLQAENEEMKPKALFADCVTASETSILVRDFAKILRQNGVDIGEKRLYKWFRENGYVIKGTCSPTQKSMEQGLFEIIERSVTRGDRPPITTMTTKITGKGQVFFINKIMNQKLKKEA